MQNNGIDCHIQRDASSVKFPFASQCSQPPKYGKGGMCKIQEARFHKCRKSAERRKADSK